MPKTNPSLSITASQVVERFPTLLMATDIPTLGVAVASAAYMREGVEPCPISDSMVRHTAGLLTQAELDARHLVEAERNPSLRVLHQYAGKYRTVRSRSLALIAFTGHRVAHSEEPIAIPTLEDYFYGAIDISKGVDGGIARNGIVQYCRSLARKDNKTLTDNERRAILAGQEVMRFTNLTPLSALMIAGSSRTQAIVNGFGSN